MHVNLLRGFAIDGWGDRDRLRNIENVLGSEGDDRLIDNGRDNTLEGDDGHDVLLFSAGKDMAEGGCRRRPVRVLGDAFGRDTIKDFRPHGRRPHPDPRGR